MTANATDLTQHPTGEKMSIDREGLRKSRTDVSRTLPDGDFTTGKTVFRWRTAEAHDAVFLGGESVAYLDGEPLANFLVAALNAVVPLLDALDAAEKERDEARAELLCWRCIQDDTVARLRGLASVTDDERALLDGTLGGLMRWGEQVLSSRSALAHDLANARKEAGLAGEQVGVLDARVKELEAALRGVLAHAEWMDAGHNRSANVDVLNARAALAKGL